VIVAVDVSHYPSRADCIVDKREQPQNDDADEYSKEDPGGPDIRVQAIEQANSYNGSKNHGSRILIQCNAVSVSASSGREVCISDDKV
jgi:hypothetical protein